MRYHYINRQSATAQALYLIDAAQRKTPYMTEGYAILERVRRRIYMSHAADLWSVAR